MNADNSGPAFPQSTGIIRDDGVLADFHGMTLRDYFAAHAIEECICVANDQTPLTGEQRLSELFAKAALYACFAADAMLAARQA